MQPRVLGRLLGQGPCWIKQSPLLVDFLGPEHPWDLAPSDHQEWATLEKLSLTFVSAIMHQVGIVPTIGKGLQLCHDCLCVLSYDLISLSISFFVCGVFNPYLLGYCED